MTTLTTLPSIFVPLVGLVFPAIAMAFYFFMLKKTRFFKYASAVYCFFKN